ncbi:uncharacterized protein LOC115338262 isoform X1 [Aquila chrysaetos chrysaetos]|uniref:uncharacterized protein LOC115338262 isoform X1 n=1 Tax=Aquila chrysaetos chrysaetos TaxID=223781 RepID=UPI001176E495|nr:uncharacterized protein LOC115338262 isoform X1 [Aquila chrysaetos chrysaetos]
MAAKGGGAKRAAGLIGVGAKMAADPTTALGCPRNVRWRVKMAASPFCRQWGSRWQVEMAASPFYRQQDSRWRAKMAASPFYRQWDPRWRVKMAASPFYRQRDSRWRVKMAASPVCRQRDSRWRVKMAASPFYRQRDSRWPPGLVTIAYHYRHLVLWVWQWQPSWPAQPMAALLCHHIGGHLGLQVHNGGHLGLLSQWRPCSATVLVAILALIYTVNGGHLDRN